MKIKSIHLKNFQRHSDLKLDFNEDINVITGLSNAGKSCIRRAIAWVCFAENISESDLRKEGTKTTTVTIEFNNGIEIERVRSSSVNRYILRKDEEENTYDSFGREVPDDIKLVLNMAKIEVDGDNLNLNIAEQLTLPFLLDKSPSLRAKLFNKLTGNELLDKLFKECNKESLRINRELKENEERLTKQKEELFECSKKYKKSNDKLTDVKLHYVKLKEDVEIYETLKILAEKLSENKRITNEVKEKSKSIKVISEDKIIALKEKYEELNKISTLINKCKEINQKLKELKETKISTIDVDFTHLKDKALLLEKYQYLLKMQETVKKRQNETKIEIEVTKELIETAEHELNEIWKNTDYCPTCKQKVCNEVHVD